MLKLKGDEKNPMLCDQCWSAYDAVGNDSCPNCGKIHDNDDDEEEEAGEYEEIEQQPAWSIGVDCSVEGNKYSLLYHGGVIADNIQGIMFANLLVALCNKHEESLNG